MHGLRFRAGFDWQRLFYVPLVFALAYTCWKLPYAHLPAPGDFAALLGVCAAVMAFHTHASLRERALWVLLLGLMCCAEFRAIQKNKDEDRQTQIDQNRQFEIVLKQGFALQIQARDQYVSTLQNVNNVLSNVVAVGTTAKSNLSQTAIAADTAKRSLEALEGAGSEPCIVPQIQAQGNLIPAVLWNRGKNVLTGVAVNIYDEDSFLKGAASRPSTELGTVEGTWPKSIPFVFQPANHVNKEGIAVYNAMISTQNGFYTESIFFRPFSRGGWDAFYMAWKQVVSNGKDGFPKGATHAAEVVGCKKTWAEHKEGDQ